MQSIINDYSASYRNQHYIIANTANGSSQNLSSSFASVPANNCFWGSLWFRASSIPANGNIRIGSFAETSASGARCLVITLIGATPAEMTVRLSVGTIDATGGIGTEQYQIRTDLINLSLNRWHKIQFFFNTAEATDVNQNLIIFDNVVQSLIVRTGAPLAVTNNMSFCRIMQQGIPAGFRLANIWLSCGTNTKAEVQGYRFGERSPIWLGAKGLYGINKPATVYMHGTKNIIQNSVNNQNFATVGASFTSLVKTSTPSEQVIL